MLVSFFKSLLIIFFLNFVNLITKLIKLELDIMNEFLYLWNFKPTTMMLNLLLILRCAAYGNECDCSKKKIQSKT